MSKLKDTFLGLFSCLICCHSRPNKVAEPEPEPTTETDVTSVQVSREIDLQAMAARGPRRPSVPRGPPPQHA